MPSRILKLLIPCAFGLLLAIPAAADIRGDIGPLHIRIATDAPPHVRYEHRSARPSRDAIWIKGYWDRRGDRWEWVAGRWEQPPNRHERWIDARYRRESGAWRYEPAHWSHQQLVEDDDYRHWREEHRHNSHHHDHN